MFAYNNVKEFYYTERNDDAMRANLAQINGHALTASNINMIKISFGPFGVRVFFSLIFIIIEVIFIV